jgi:hypothetical protein
LPAFGAAYVPRWPVSRLANKAGTPFDSSP